MFSVTHGSPPPIPIRFPNAPSGRSALAVLLHVGQSIIHEKSGSPLNDPVVFSNLALGRIRGTGPGVSFGAMVRLLEAEFPRELRFPFEGSDRVGGAVWSGDLLDPPLPHSLAKLRWEPGADDLPMHAHEFSDRCIFVLEGRGFFHYTDESLHGFTGNRIKTIAARERDMFAFTRGTLHTFSTVGSGMTLLSCQLPFLPFDDPRQYTLPSLKWIARDHLAPNSGVITLDWHWATAAGPG